MEISEFIEETSRIENFFEKELTDMQRKEWFRELQNLPINRYRQIVMETFRKCKFMPKLADITEINNNLPYNTSTTQNIEKVDCKICNKEGVVKYFREIVDGDRTFKYEYFAKCNCQNGKEFNYDGTTISDVKHRSKYYIPTLEQIFMNKERGVENGN